MTKEQTCTPGILGAPWRYVPMHIAEGPSEVRAKEGWLVCTTSSDEIAALIAQAPSMVRRIKELEAANAELLAALKSLADKADECGKLSAGIFQFAAIHEVVYDGPNYADEIKAARAAIAKMEGREP